MAASPTQQEEAAQPTQQAPAVTGPPVAKGPATQPSGAPTQQLPQGAAKDINDQIVAGNAADAQAATGPAAMPPTVGQPTTGPTPQAGPAPTAPAGFKPRNEFEEFLHSPNDGPPSHPFAGLTRAMLPHPPQGVIDALPAFEFAANHPAAPPQLQDILNAILFHLSQANQSPSA